MGIETFKTSWVSRCSFCAEEGIANRTKRTDAMAVWDKDGNLLLERENICLEHQKELKRSGHTIE